ncbi:AAA family ATPase [Streptomyces sp. C8S0]|uniref:AAA family ATPase n=1 Tax=Streptomyces sp. C8S0 TaxID=2585716 RepID=UPI001D05B59D
MRLETIKIENFRGLTHVDIPFSRFGCLIGENNAGKSSVFQALNMFLKSGTAVDTDFLDRSRSIRIQLSFSEVSEADLKRLEDGHRTRIEREIRDGRITLAKVYKGPGRGPSWSSRGFPRSQVHEGRNRRHIEVWATSRSNRRQCEGHVPRSCP